MLAVTILGNNSAIPAFDRHPTAQVVTLNEHLFLIDCGEGTQMQITKYRIKRSRMHHIFISHLHGDHYLGLIGLSPMMGLLVRASYLHLYAPAPLKEIIDLQLKIADTIFPFKLYFLPLEEGLLVRTDKFEVSCFNVFHRITCWGFLFREVKPPRKIDGERIKQYNIPVSYYDELRWGKHYVAPDGNIVLNEAVTEPAAK